MVALDAELIADLAALERRGLRRSLRTIHGASTAEVTVDGQQVVLLSSNNYLGLSTHPAVIAAARDALTHYGCSAGSSRLIAGHFDLHAAVETQLAAFKGTEAALLFPTGYHANVGTIGALVGRGDHVFSDALNHASIIDGCRLSRAAVHVYPHNDIATLTAMLAATPCTGRRLIVTDSVFSMDGDRAPLAALTALAESVDAILMIDEAHATGCLGHRGAGLADELSLTPRIAIHMGTLGKALGGMGAYIAGSQALIDVVVNRARSFIFTTGLTPAMVAAAGAAIEIVATEPERRAALHRNATLLREGLSRIGLSPSGDTHILPVPIGDNARALAFAAGLLRRGVYVQAIRPPTVPAGTARLRVTPMATHSPAQLARTLDAFAAVAHELRS